MEEIINIIKEIRKSENKRQEKSPELNPINMIDRRNVKNERNYFK